MVFTEFTKRFSRCDCDKVQDLDEYKKFVDNYKVFSVANRPDKFHTCVVVRLVDKSGRKFRHGFSIIRSKYQDGSEWQLI